jgi:hypothetical protein
MQESAGTERRVIGHLKDGAEQVPLLRLGLWFAASRLLILAVAGIALHVVPAGPYAVHGKLVDWFRHWDADWYLSIVLCGYSYDPHAQSNVAFFPLYPLLIRLVGEVVPNFALAGY